MSVSQSVILDPSFHSNKRTEFKIYNKGRVFQPNLRLVNFGVENIQTMQPSANFAVGGGLHSVIKNIYLYFNDILVDQIKDASQYLSIKNLAKPVYTVFRNYNNQLNCSNIILTRSQLDETVLQLNEGSNKLVGMLDLTQVFPLLSIMNTPTQDGVTYLADINEIRVSVEYESSIPKIFSEPIPDGFSVSQPAIIYTEMFNVPVTNTNFDLSVTVIENERIILNAVTSKQNIRVRAFDGKILSHILFQNVSANAPDDLCCLQYSDVLQDEHVNIMVNGTSLLPFQGVDNECKKLSWTTDSMALGTHFSPLGSAMDNVGGAGHFAKYDARLQLLQSKLSYLGLNVNKIISRIDYEVSYRPRFDPADDPIPVTVYIYGGVTKTISKRGDTIVSQYNKIVR